MAFKYCHQGIKNYCISSGCPHRWHIICSPDCFWAWVQVTSHLSPFVKEGFTLIWTALIFGVFLTVIIKTLYEFLFGCQKLNMSARRLVDSLKIGHWGPVHDSLLSGKRKFALNSFWLDILTLTEGTAYGLCGYYMQGPWQGPDKPPSSPGVRTSMQAGINDVLIQFSF